MACLWAGIACRPPGAEAHGAEALCRRPGGPMISAARAMLQSWHWPLVRHASQIIPAALTAVLPAILICAPACTSGARAQQQPKPAAPPVAAPAPPGGDGLSIEWQVRNRFPAVPSLEELTSCATSRPITPLACVCAASICWARHRRPPAGAQENEVDHLCVNAAGGLSPTPATATARKAIWRRGLRGGGAADRPRCRPTPPATGASTTASFRRNK